MRKCCLIINMHWLQHIYTLKTNQCYKYLHFLAFTWPDSLPTEVPGWKWGRTVNRFQMWSASLHLLTWKQPHQTQATIEEAKRVAEAEIKWQLQVHFLEWKCGYFHLNISCKLFRGFESLLNHHWFRKWFGTEKKETVWDFFDRNEIDTCLPKSVVETHWNFRVIQSITPMSLRDCTRFYHRTYHQFLNKGPGRISSHSR